MATFSDAFTADNMTCRAVHATSSSWALVCTRVSAIRPWQRPLPMQHNSHAAQWSASVSLPFLQGWQSHTGSPPIRQQMAWASSRHLTKMPTVSPVMMSAAVQRLHPSLRCHSRTCYTTSGLTPWLPDRTDILNAIFSTGAAVALIATLFLDNTVPGSDRERGLHVW